MSKNAPSKKNEIEEDKDKFIHEALWKIIHRHDRLIETTNAKAALSIAFNTFVFGGIVLKWRELLPDFNECPVLAICGILLLAIAALASIGSLYYTIYAVKPFLESNSDSLLFFKDVAANDGDAYYEKVKEMSHDSLNKDLAYQIHILSRGMSEKFDRLKKATRISKCQVLVLGLFFVVKIIEFLSGS